MRAPAYAFASLSGTHEPHVQRRPHAVEFLRLNLVSAVEHEIAVPSLGKDLELMDPPALADEVSLEPAVPIHVVPG